MNEIGLRGFPSRTGRLPREESQSRDAGPGAEKYRRLRRGRFFRPRGRRGRLCRPFAGLACPGQPTRDEIFIFSRVRYEVRRGISRPCQKWPDTARANGFYSVSPRSLRCRKDGKFVRWDLKLRMFIGTEITEREPDGTSVFPARIQT